MFDSVFGVGIISASKMQYLFVSAGILNEIDALDKLKSFVHKTLGRSMDRSIKRWL